MCWNFLSVLSPTVTADISAPYFQQKKTNKVALEHIFNKFIKKRLINLGKKREETMNTFCTLHEDGEKNTFKDRNPGY